MQIQVQEYQMLVSVTRQTVTSELEFLHSYEERKESMEDI